MLQRLLTTHLPKLSPYLRFLPLLPTEMSQHFVQTWLTASHNTNKYLLSQYQSIIDTKRRCLISFLRIISQSSLLCSENGGLGDGCEKKKSTKHPYSHQRTKMYRKAAKLYIKAPSRIINEQG